MRWIVEVGSLEKTDTQSYCVEAESWQGALQAARRLRGDESRMAGFSIDITNDGCKAVDPAKKIRYEVKRTTDDTPLTPGGEAPPQSKRKISSPPKGAAPSAPRADATVKMEGVPSNIELPPSSSPSVAKAAAAAPAPASPPAAAARPAPDAAPVVVPPIVIRREQAPTPEVPLTYREYGFALPPGTTEEAAVQALRDQLARIQNALTGAPPGKLVNLAAFDTIFQGRPPVLPLATLTWKDWKADASVAFPRRARPVHAAPAPAAVAVPAPVAAPVAAPAPVPVAAPVSLEFPGTEPVSHARPIAPPAAGPPAAAPAVKKRVRGDELISVLFEAMHDLHFLRDSIEGGDFCLHLALEKLPSKLGVIYLYDIDRREFVIVCAQGETSTGLVAKRFAETEPVLSAAMRKRRAILLSADDAATAEHTSPLGGGQSLVLAPVMQAGRFLGAIELVDPQDSVPFTELDANGVTYMAEQYAEFVAARGIQLDRERASHPPVVQTP